MLLPIFDRLDECMDGMETSFEALWKATELDAIPDEVLPEVERIRKELKGVFDSILELYSELENSNTVEEIYGQNW